MKRAAVFVDRDGTLIRDFHFISRPEQVELLPGAADAVRRLNEAGWPVIVVTNQSGIARGYFTEADYRRVHERLEQLLADGGEGSQGSRASRGSQGSQGSHIDAEYLCPHHPDFTGPCECRKPGTLLFRRAATERHIDTAASWYIGDKLRDVLPAKELGGRGLLVPNVETDAADVELARREFEVAASLDEAVGRVIESAG